MPQGAPDYFSVIDIRAQTLARIINRPVYGSARIAEALKVLDPYESVDLVTVLGQGRFYSMEVLGDLDANVRDVQWTLHIDGYNVVGYSFNLLRMWGLNQVGFGGVALVQDDDTLIRYTAVILGEFTFESVLKAGATEINGATGTRVSVKVRYSLVA